MRRVFQFACLSLCCSFFALTSFLLAADESPEAAAPQDLRSALAKFEDPAFEAYASIELIQQAVASGNAELLADVALQVGQGEKVLHRPRKGVTAQILFQSAIQAATDAGEPATLERLEAGAKELGLKDTLELIAASKKLAGTARKLEMAPGLRPEDTTAESMVLYNALVQEVRKAKQRGLEADLEDLKVSVSDLPLHELQKTHLLKLTEETLVAMKGAEAPAEEEGDDAVITQLAGATRFLPLQHTLRLVTGPAVVKAGATSTYTIVMSKASKTPTIVWVTGLYMGTPGKVTVPVGKSSVTFKATAMKQTVPVKYGNIRVQQERGTSNGMSITIKK